jgi:hypothetical protein
MIFRWRHRLLTSVLLLVSTAVPFQLASAQGQKFFAYNNTTRTDFTGVYMAPAGTGNWGPNQALNDKDKALDTGERFDAYRIIAWCLLRKAGRSLRPNLHLTGCGSDEGEELRDPGQAALELPLADSSYWQW